MTFDSASSRWIALLFLGISLAGCSLNNNVQDEEQDSHYLAGKSCQQNMDYKGAAEAYKKALEANPNSSAAHRELGLLYADKLTDGVTAPDERDRNYSSAIYHLEEFLQLNPKSPFADRARQQIMGCKFELAKTVPFTLVSSGLQHELERLNTTNTVLRQQVEQLKLQLAQQAYTFSNRLAALQTQYASVAGSSTNTYENAAVVHSGQAVTPSTRSSGQSTGAVRQSTSVGTQPAGAIRTSSAPARLPTGIRSYTIRPGDTLASIARRYGIPVNALTAANPGLDPRRLKAGQKLNIPSTRS